jgi:hypothetical protein
MSEWRKKLPMIAVTLLALLVALRLALPSLVERQINIGMAQLGEYHGYVGDVDLHLWRGAYAINDMVIEKSSGKIPVPLFKAPHIDLSVSWREIFHGAIVAEVIMEYPEINLVDGRGSADRQSGSGVDWREQLERLLPISLNSVQVDNGTVSFHNFTSNPSVDLEATDVQATILNLANVRGDDGKRVATFDARANLLGQAPLEAHARFDPFNTPDEFDFDVRVLKIELTRLNQFFQAYAKLDVASGHGDFVMELEVSEGQLKGSAKPLFQDVNILSWQQDVKEQHDNPLRLAWEWLTGVVVTIFKNQDTDQFATRIAISGNLNDPKIGKWDALAAILRNAFVKAYEPQLDQVKKNEP